MDKAEIRKELETILAIVDEKFKGRPAISDATLIRDGLGLDSLQLTEMLFEIEERLGAKISDEEARELKSVGDIISLIDAKVKEKSTGA